jgi:DNA-binding protein YbaB
MNPAKMFQMQREAKQMQKKLQARKIVGSSKDESVKIFMNASQEFEDVYISVDLLEQGMEERIKRNFKEAFKDYQKKLQKEMMKDFDMESLGQFFK